MIKQEKRKRRWLVKNGFTLVTEGNKQGLIDEAIRLEYGLMRDPLRCYAYTTISYEYYDAIYLIDRTEAKRDLHEIKLNYLVRLHGQRPVSKAIKLAWKLKKIHSQWAALIKHGVNPWW